MGWQLMKKDRKLDEIYLLISKEKKIEPDVVEKVVEAYFNKIGDLIKEDEPYSIKLDFLGKIRTTERKFNEKELISFELLKKKDEVI